MEILTKTVEAYQYDELSKEAKAKAREGFSDINVDHEWYDCAYEDTKEIGKILGITVDHIYFSGFSSQGDGACFEGSYKYAKDSVKNLFAHAPQDKELMRIALALREEQKESFYQLTARIKHSGHYQHKYCTTIDVYRADPKTGNEDSAPGEIQDQITTLLRDFMEWIYRTLETEYDYLTGTEAIEETIKANEYQFTKDGIFPAL